MDSDGFGWFRGRTKRQKKLDTGEFFAEETVETALTGRPIITAAVATGEGRASVGALIFIDSSRCQSYCRRCSRGHKRSRVLRRQQRSARSRAEGC